MERNKGEIKVYALGGLGEVGKNCYGIEYNNQIVLIDCGILFPNMQLFGIDYVIPDFTYLEKNQKKIVGLFITHGHEDHIGSIPFLAKKIKLPKIYASGIAIDLIKAKLEEYKDIPEPTIIPYNSDSVFKFNKIEISFARLNHSIPDSHAIIVKTDLGTIVHTGDFKVDFTPIGPSAEYHKLAALGSEGVTLLLADSTNAMQEGFSKSELKIGQSINELISKITGRIIIATFASNMYRIDQIIQAAKKNGRKVCIMGKSMLKAVEIGMKNGCIDAKIKDFIDEDKINNFMDNELLVLCTGSQGEPMAALSRVAQGNNKNLQLKKSDTIIFSSSPIPGNQESINRIVDSIFKMGANVITNSPLNDTHTTGHANEGELKMIHTLLKPKYFMPIHGEYRMLKIHGKIANSCGVDVKNIFVMDNGDILHINDKKAFVKDHVNYGEVYIDQSKVGGIETTIIKDRRQLSIDGLFALVVPIEENFNLHSNFQVFSRGFIYMKDNEELVKTLIEEARRIISEQLYFGNTNFDSIAHEVEEHLIKYLKTNYEREPIVICCFSVIK